MSRPEEPASLFATLPDPGQATTLDGLVERLRLLKAWAGNSSYETIKDRVNAGRPAAEPAGKTTVVDCFRLGRRRLDPDLVVSVVQALHPDLGYVAQWRQALRVIDGERGAASQVRVHDSLPPDVPEFTGRAAELDRLVGGAAGIAAIEGMAGVGKTQLAVHAARRLLAEHGLDRVLYVGLRGFHPDPTQPPADPAAVLDGFLRLLGLPGQAIPHDLDGRIKLYRERLSGTRTLIVLDDAAGADQVRPLLPDTAGCPVLVTSRQNLTGLHPATRLVLAVFTPDEARQLLGRAAPGIPVGDDAGAATRIVEHCGRLPLALSLVSGHMRARPGWTLTDHADWLDDRHDANRLDAGIELALSLSYQHLPAERQRMLRLLALHPGDDLDAYAAAAVAGTDLPTARAHLARLHGDHLLQQGTAGRYAAHDLVRAYAITRAQDEDRPAERRAALTRLFDHYLATAAAAMDTLYPAETHRRPRIPPAGTPAPDLSDPDQARHWLDTERPILVTVAAHTAAHGWPTHTGRLARILYRYLEGGHHTAALALHGHAQHAAGHTGDPADQAHALINLGVTHLRLGRHDAAAEHLRPALALFRQAGDPGGQARTLTNLGLIELLSGRHRPAADHYAQSLALHRAAGDQIGEARALGNLGDIETLLSRHQSAADHYRSALALFRQVGDRAGETHVLSGLGYSEVRSGQYGPAGDHLREALARYRQLGHRDGEVSALDSLGLLHTRLGRPAEAIDHHRQALTITRQTGDRDGEAWALNGLGEAARSAGNATDALAHHTEAQAVAADIGSREQQARAHTGLGHAQHALGNVALAREHYQHAVTLYTELDLPEAAEVRAHLT